MSNPTATIVTVRTDWSEMRQVDIDITGAPDLARRRTSQAFQPDRVTCTLRRECAAPEWRLAGVLATGPERLRSGGLSTANHTLRNWVGEDLTELPHWLRTIADTALADAVAG